jgi:hypothetical protein
LGFDAFGFFAQFTDLSIPDRHDPLYEERKNVVVAKILDSKDRWGSLSHD